MVNEKRQVLSAPPGDCPPISVVVPTRNRPQSLLTAARLILDNDYPVYELLIVDQSEDDETAQILEPLLDTGRVRRFKAGPLGVSAARNLGIANAKYELIALTDDDCRVPSDWLTKLARAFDEVPQCGVVFGNVLPGELDPELGFIPCYVRDEAFIARNSMDKSQTEGLTACMGLRKKVWSRLGGFDERFGAGAPLRAAAEVDFVVRVLDAKIWIYETPDFELVHDGFRNWSEARKLISRYWWGAGAVYGMHFRRRPWQVFRLLTEICLWRAATGSRVRASLGSHSFLARRVTAFASGFAKGLLLKSPNQSITASDVEPIEVSSVVTPSLETTRRHV